MPSVYVPSNRATQAADVSEGAGVGVGGNTMMSHTGNIGGDLALHRAGSSSMGSPAVL